jgi:dihydrolipoamide dehydrogenase
VEYDKQGIAVNERMETSVDNVYAVGDAVGGILLAHLATAEGLAAAANATGGEETVDYAAVPNCIYTFPEVAGVGLTEEEAKEQDLDFEVTKFPFSANSRAAIGDDTEGIVKLMADASSGRVLGVHLFGPHATELIHEGVIAVQNELTVEDLANSIHAHPTLFESMGEAAHGAVHDFIHYVRRRRSQ